MRKNPGFTLVEMLFSVGILSVVTWSLMVYMQGTLNIKQSHEDTIMAYDGIDAAFSAVDPLLKTVGLGTPTNIRKNKGTFIAYKPYDEFCISWLAKTIATSPPPVRLGFSDKAFGINRNVTTASDVAGYVGFGPLRITGPWDLWDSSKTTRSASEVNGLDNDELGSDPQDSDLWFLFAIPSGVAIKKIEVPELDWFTSDSFPKDGYARVPLSSLYYPGDMEASIETNLLKQRKWLYAFMNGYWNDGFDSIKLTLENTNAITTLTASDGTNAKVFDASLPSLLDNGHSLAQKVNSIVSFGPWRLFALQSVHNVLQHGSLSDLRSWILIPSFRVPLAVASISTQDSALIVKPAPGAAYAKQIATGTHSTIQYNDNEVDNGLLMGGQLSVGEQIWYPRMGHIWLDRQNQQIKLDLYSSFGVSGSGSVSPYESTVIMDKAIGLRFSYDPYVALLTMTVAAQGTRLEGDEIGAIPISWPMRRTGERAPFSKQEREHRIFVRSKTWQLSNIR